MTAASTSVAGRRASVNQRQTVYRSGTFDAAAVYQGMWKEVRSGLGIRGIKARSSSFSLLYEYKCARCLVELLAA